MPFTFDHFAGMSQATGLAVFGVVMFVAIVMAIVVAARQD